MSPLDLSRAWASTRITPPLEARRNRIGCDRPVTGFFRLFRRGLTTPARCFELAFWPPCGDVRRTAARGRAPILAGQGSFNNNKNDRAALGRDHSLPLSKSVLARACMQ